MLSKLVAFEIDADFNVPLFIFGMVDGLVLAALVCFVLSQLE